MKAERLYIYGAGGTGREVLETLWSFDAPPYGSVFFIDDSLPAGSTVCGVQVVALDDAAAFAAGREVEAVIAVGQPLARQSLFGRLEAAGIRPASIIDPTAIVRKTASIAPGCIIAPRVVVSAAAQVGANVLVNIGSVIGHDSRIGPHSVIGPLNGVLGGVRVEEGCETGSGCHLFPRITLGSWSRVGTGSTVIRDVAPHSTVAGSPARSVAQRSSP